MKKPVFIFVVVLIAVIGGLFAGRYITAPGDRIYKGKRLSQWVSLCVRKPGNSFSPSESEVRVIVEIGSEAVPHLLKAIKGDPGFIASKIYKNLYEKLPLRITKDLPIPVDKRIIIFRGYATIEALGPAGKPAVPFLAEQFRAGNPQLDYVRSCLVALGPEAREAIPVLTNAFHGTNQFLRWIAARSLAKVDPDNPELIPTMLDEIKGTNVIARRGASLVLGGLGPRAESAVPALTEALADQDKAVRENADRALRAIQLSSNRPPAHLF